jgi:hypothetical protein
VTPTRILGGRIGGQPISPPSFDVPHRSFEGGDLPDRYRSYRAGFLVDIEAACIRISRSVTDKRCYVKRVKFPPSPSTAAGCSGHRCIRSSRNARGTLPPTLPRMSGQVKGASDRTSVSCREAAVRVSGELTSEGLPWPSVQRICNAASYWHCGAEKGFLNRSGCILIQAASFACCLLA